MGQLVVVDLADVWGTGGANASSGYWRLLRTLAAMTGEAACPAMLSQPAVAPVEVVVGTIASAPNGFSFGASYGQNQGVNAWRTPIVLDGRSEPIVWAATALTTQLALNWSLGIRVYRDS